MKKAKNNFGKRLGEEAKLRGAFFRKYLDKEVILTGNIITTHDVLSVGYVGKSVLFGNLNINNIGHIWIHRDEFKNYNVETADWSIPITIKGTVYQYSRCYKGKVWIVKYSLKNVEVL